MSMTQARCKTYGKRFMCFLFEFLRAGGLPCSVLLIHVPYLFFTVMSSNTSSCEDLALPSAAAAEIAKTAAYLLIFAISTVGNLLVIIIVVKNSRLRSVALNQFIVSMAIADFMTSLFNMTVEIWIHVKKAAGQQIFWFEGAGGVVLCKSIVFVQGLSIACSVLTLIAIAVNRFFAVFYPLKMGSYKSVSTFTIAFIWLVSFATSSPMLYAMKVIQREDGNLHCIEQWSPAFEGDSPHKNYTLFLLTLLYALPLAAISILYTAIVRKVWKRQVPGNLTAPNQLVELATKKRVLRMLITVVIVFGLCWLPYYTYLCMNFVVDSCPPANVMFIGLFLGHANSAINPCIYAVFNKEYRSSLRSFNRACLPRLPGSRIPRTTNQNTMKLTEFGTEGTTRELGKRPSPFSEMKGVTQPQLKVC